MIAKCSSRDVVSYVLMNHVLTAAKTPSLALQNQPSSEAPLSCGEDSWNTLMEMSSDWFLAETFCGSGECHKREVSLFKVGQIFFFCPHPKCEDLRGSFSEITFVYMLQTIRMNHHVSCKNSYSLFWCSKCIYFAWLQKRLRTFCYLVKLHQGI